MESSIKILSANCQGLNSIEKRLDLFDYLKSKQCHIYCLQDTHFTPALDKFIQSQWDNNGCLFSSYRSNARGTCILFSKNVDYKVHDHLSDPEGNYLIADLTVDTDRFTLVSLYAPNTDCPSFFENLFTKVESFNNSNPVIYCGDFNLVQDPKLDYYKYIALNNSKAREKLLDMKDNYNLIDPFRENCPTLQRFTWRKKNAIKMGRLDFFLISERLHSSVNKCTILPSYRSDHSMIT